MSHSNGHALGGLSILVVEDEEVLRYAVARLLASEGAEVREAANGVEAIGIITTTPVDLLLTDMDLPGLDGAGIAMAATAISPRIAIVFMSGRPLHLHIASGRLTNDVCMIEKPFAASLLLEKLAAAVSTAAGLTKATIVAG